MARCRTFPLDPVTYSVVIATLVGVALVLRNVWVWLHWEQLSTPRRGGRVLGVLVVQNRTPRHYTEDEIEVLQTIAMIVAELAASGELVNPLEMAQSQPKASPSRA